MLHIILTILKILGIIILCVLGILICVLAAVLFAPIKYSVSAEKKEEQPISKAGVVAKVSWLLFVVRGVFVLENGKAYYKIRIFGIDILKLLEKRNESKVRIKNESSKKDKTAEKPKSEKNDIVKDTSVKLNTKEPDADLIDVASEVKTQEGKKSIIDKIKSVIAGIKEKIRSAKEKILGIKNKIKEIWNRIKYYKEELGKEENRQAIGFVWGKIKEALNHIKPRKLIGTITFGMDSPDKTGQSLGVIAIFYPVFCKGFSIKPDFTKPCIYGNIIAKGRIRIFTLLIICIKLIRSKELKRLKNVIGK